MNARELLHFLRTQPWAVEATVGAGRAPQAAAIGVAVTDAFELVFDTLSGTRKAANLRADPRIALVIGWDDAQTVQIEGVADEPRGDELAALLPVYFARFPDGVARQRWPGITWFRVRPRWLRHSDFRGAQPAILELEGDALRAFLGSRATP